MPRTRERSGDEWKSCMPSGTDEADWWWVSDLFFKKIYFSEFSGFSHSLCMSYYIGVFFHPEKDLKIMKPKNWKVSQGYFKDIDLKGS